MIAIGRGSRRIILFRMKKLVGQIVAASIAMVFTSCDEKRTTIVETRPDSDRADGALPDAPPDARLADNPILAALSPEDRERFEGWFKKYNLSPDPAVMDQDPDGDGYPNREEFLAGTNPRDPRSMPGLVEGVSVKAVEEVRIPMMLREVKGSVARIERTDAAGTEDLTVGSQPKGLPYKVTAVKHELKADKHGVLTDVSNVTLENTGTKETVILIRDLPARSSETHAVVVGADGTEMKVHLDETVELPGLPGKKFKILELRADQVVVEELATKRAMTIPKR